MATADMTVHVTVNDAEKLHKRFDHIDSRLEQIMTALDDLNAAVAAEGDALQALKDEQATFLTDIAAALAAAGSANGIDPAALAPITDAIQARVADLQALTAAEVAADPAAAEAPAEPVAE